MAKKTKSFSVDGLVKVWTNVTIEAEDLEDAAVKAQELGVLDFVKMTGDHNDSFLRILGVHDNDWESV